MLSSITPLGERGHGRRWGVTVAWYVAGSLLGGAGVGAVLGLAGQAVPTPAAPAAPVLAALLVLAAAVDAVLLGRPLPGVRRQVNEDWLRIYRGWVIGAGYGVQLGAGVVTIVTTATVYLTFVIAVLAGSWVTGLAVGTAFGFARALPVLGLARVTSPERLGTVHARIAAWAPLARHAVVVSSLALALGTVWAW